MRGFTLEAKFLDGSPRRYAGTWRPPRDEAEAMYEELPHERTIHSMQSGDAPSFFDLNWQRGVLDLPLYHVEEWE